MYLCVCLCVSVGFTDAEDMVKVWEVVGELIKPGECRIGET